MLSINLDYEFDEAIDSIVKSNSEFRTNNKTKLNYGIYYTPKR